MSFTINGYELQSEEKLPISNNSYLRYRFLSTPSSSLPFEYLVYEQSENLFSCAEIFLLKLQGQQEYSVVYISPYLGIDSDFDLALFNNPGSSLSDAIKIISSLNFYSYHQLPVIRNSKIELSPSESSKKKKLRKKILDDILKRDPGF
ncbi:MAG: hypothetical protein VX028_00685 [Nanoarchaeota archaeon]|nr:hypothetical protein [Nanoarchaeota archaeon]